MGWLLDARRTGTSKTRGSGRALLHKPCARAAQHVSVSPRWCRQTFSTSALPTCHDRPTANTLRTFGSMHITVNPCHNGLTIASPSRSSSACLTSYNAFPASHDNPHRATHTPHPATPRGGGAAWGSCDTLPWSSSSGSTSGLSWGGGVPRWGGGVPRRAVRAPCQGRNNMHRRCNASRRLPCLVISVTVVHGLPLSQPRGVRHVWHGMRLEGRVSLE